jgi:hypothetical protein
MSLLAETYHRRPCQHATLAPQGRHMLTMSVLFRSAADDTHSRLQVVHQFFVQFTGLSLETVQEETDRDNFLSPQQAMELGLIDAVL